MREELTLLHYPDNNQKNWWVFNSKDCPDPFWFPGYLYRKYEFEERKSKQIFDILLQIRDKLVELSILPSPANENIIFPTAEELYVWDIEIKKIVFERIDLILKK